VGKRVVVGKVEELGVGEKGMVKGEKGIRLEVGK
jgi:hypothetical protein